MLLPSLSTELLPSVFSVSPTTSFCILCQPYYFLLYSLSALLLPSVFPVSPTTSCFVHFLPSLFSTSPSISFFCQFCCFILYHTHRFIIIPAPFLPYSLSVLLLHSVSAQLLPSLFSISPVTSFSNSLTGSFSMMPATLYQTHRFFISPISPSFSPIGSFCHLCYFCIGERAVSIPAVRTIS